MGQVSLCFGNLFFYRFRFGHVLLMEQKKPSRPAARRALGSTSDGRHSLPSKVEGSWSASIRDFLGEASSSTVDGLSNDRNLISMNRPPSEVKDASTQHPDYVNIEDLDQVRLSEKHYLSVAPEILRVLYQHRTDSLKSKLAIDLDRPPLDCIQDIFDDIAKKAEELGFNDVLSHLGSRKLRVVTMCSGTESPLLSLKMFAESKSIHRLVIFMDKTYY